MTTPKEWWQEDKALNERFWLYVMQIAKWKGIDVRYGHMIVDRAFGSNYMEHDGSFAEAVGLLVIAADELIALDFLAPRQLKSGDS